MIGRLQSFPLTHFIVLPLLYYVGARIGVYLTVMPEGIAILWPPNSVLLATLILFQGRYFLPFAALALGAEVAADLPAFTLSEAILFGLINIVEAAVIFILLTRWRFNPRIAGPDDLLKFVLAGPLVGAFVAALFGALTYSYFRGNQIGYLEFLRIWWFGDALGLMILTPLLLRWWIKGDNNRPASIALGPVDGLVSLVAVVVLGLFMASSNGIFLGLQVGPVLFLPFVIFAAARFETRWVAVSVAAVAFVIMAMMTSGRNPFGNLPPRQAVIAAQEFIFIMSLMALGLNTLLGQLHLKQAEIEHTNAELRQKADSLEQNNIKLQQAEAEVLALNVGLERRVRERTQELEEALARVTQLHGLLPICSWCKKIRDDENYWHSVEQYISERTQAQFSHGICPECKRKYFGEV